MRREKTWYLCRRNNLRQLSPRPLDRLLNRTHALLQGQIPVENARENECTITKQLQKRAKMKNVASPRAVRLQLSQLYGNSRTLRARPRPGRGVVGSS